MPTIPVTIGPLQRRLPQLLRNRRNAHTLTPDQLKKLRSALAASYELEDDRGYAFFAGLHGLPLPKECNHTNSLWLPWHRAYLYYFEMSLRDLEPTVTLPWWDWTTGTMPVAYTTPASGNPLTAAEIPAGAGGPTQTTRNGPSGLPTPQQLKFVMDLTDWDDFTAQLRQLHNNVHNAFAPGSMMNPDIAAFDPIFWAHHAFCDRAWRLWQAKNASFSFSESFLNTALAPFPMTVRQTMSVTRLGYEYARSTISIPFTPKTLQPVGGNA